MFQSVGSFLAGGDDWGGAFFSLLSFFCPRRTGAGPGIRDWALASDLLFSWNFGGYSAGTRQIYLWQFAVFGE